MSSYYYAKNNNTNRFSSTSGGRSSRNESDNNNNDRIINIKSDMLGNVNKAFELSKFGTNIEVSELLDSYEYIWIFLNIAGLIQTLFNKIMNPVTNGATTRLEVSKVMNEIVPSKFVNMEADQTKVGKLTTATKTWNQKFRKGTIRNELNGNNDVFYFIGDISLPPK